MTSCPSTGEDGSALGCVTTGTLGATATLVRLFAASWVAVTLGPVKLRFGRCGSATPSSCACPTPGGPCGPVSETTLRHAVPSWYLATVISHPTRIGVA